MLDCGANVSFITASQCCLFGVEKFIKPAGQLALQADGKTQLQVRGELKMTLTRTTSKNECLQFKFHALVVDKLNNCDVIGGQNFLIENHIDLFLKKRKIAVQEKYYFEETPSDLNGPLIPGSTHLSGITDVALPYESQVKELAIVQEQKLYPAFNPKFQYQKLPPQLLSLQTAPPPTCLSLSEQEASKPCIYNLRKIGVLWPGDKLTLELPDDIPANADIIIEPRLENKVNDWIPQEVTADERTFTIENYSTSPVIYGKGKDTEMLQIRVATHTPDISENTAIPKKVDRGNNVPHGLIEEIVIDSSNISESQLKQIKQIHEKFESVFNKDLSQGASQQLSSSLADWNWAGDCKPPVHVSKVPIYTNKQGKDMLQDKIDYMYQNDICDVYDTRKYGPLEYCSPCMLVPKSSAKDKTVLSHEDYRFVMLHNKQNDWISTQPARSVNIPDALYETGQWNFIVETDLFHGFWQRTTVVEKLPQCAFHSPFKGTFVMLRGSQGRKNESEQLDEWLSQVLGDLIKAGKVLKLHDDIRVGGKTADEAISNWALVLSRMKAHNIKLHPKKTKIFPQSTPIFGFIKEGQNLKPNPHSILAIHKTPKPSTTTQLRGYLGQFKTFFKHVPNCARILETLEKFVSKFPGKNQPLVWDSSASASFDKSKQEIVNAANLYLPKRDDQLAVTVDWSQEGIGGTLWAILQSGHVPVCFFSQSNEPAMKKYPPCDGEASAGAATINFFKTYLREALKPTIVMFDNRTVVLAAALLARGCFSTGKRLNALLANINNFNIKIQHLSGKLGLNKPSDLLSRTPLPLCKHSNCDTCKFLRSTAESLSSENLKKYNVEPQSESCTNITSEIDYVAILRATEEAEPIDIGKVIRGETELSFMSKPVLKKLQMEDEELLRVKFYLTSGNRALMKDNKCPQVKKYINSGAKVANDGLIVIEKDVPHSIAKVKVPVLPRDIARGILHSTHIKLDHPTCSQNKKAMDRYCFSIDQNKTIDDICNNCHLCNSLRMLPVEIPNFSPSEPPEHPGTHWTADVMKYGKKNILVASDNLSSFTVASISGGERAEQLEEAIMLAILPFKSRATDVLVRVDTAPGLAKLKKTEKLAKDGIKLDPGHVKNPNSCAKVDKIMSELRRELKILNPEEKTLTPSNLARAVANLNCRTRQLGLSSREILFQRDQQTDQNIPLSDSSLKMQTSATRDKNRQYSAKSQSNSQSKPSTTAHVKVGNLVHLKEEKDKGSARELYIVVDSTEPEHLKIKKLLHSLGNNQMSLRHEEYVVTKDKVYLAPNQPSGPPSSPPPFTLTPVRAPTSLSNHSPHVKLVKKIAARYHPPPIKIDSDDEDLIEDEENHGILDLSSLSLTSDLGPSLGSPEADDAIDDSIEMEELDVDRMIPTLDDDNEDENEEDPTPGIEMDDDAIVEAHIEENVNDETEAEGDATPALIDYVTRDNLQQHRVPKKGDAILVFQDEGVGWYEIKLCTSMLKGYPFYYHCTFPDSSKGGIYLIPGERWTFLEDTAADDDDDFDDTEEDDGEKQEQSEPETENLRTSNLSSDQPAMVTPDTSTRDMGLQTSFDSSYEDPAISEDQFMDDDFEDQQQLTIETDPYEFIDFQLGNIEIPDYPQPYNLIDVSVPFADIGQLPQIPPNMTVDSTRRYELIQRLNLDVPDDGSLVEGHVYALPDEAHFFTEDQIRQNPYVAETSSLNHRPRVPKAPKFLRRFNPFRKRK